jgi:hypothetical protein
VDYRQSRRRAPGGQSQFFLIFLIPRFRVSLNCADWSFAMIFHRCLLAVSLLCVVGVTVAQDLPANLPPKFKPGLWEVQAQIQPQEQTQTFRICMDKNTEQAMDKIRLQVVENSSCKVVNTFPANGVEVSDTECTAHGGNMSAHSETHFDGDTSFRGEGIVRMNGSDTMKATTTGHWTGACGEGQKPGDVVMDNDQSMSIKEMQH